MAGFPNEEVGIDLIGPLEITESRKRYNLVMVDLSLKRCEVEADRMMACGRLSTDLCLPDLRSATVIAHEFALAIAFVKYNSMRVYILGH